MKERRWAARLALFVLASFMIFFAVRLYYRVTDDFRLVHITYDVPYKAKWDIPPLNDPEKRALQKLLGQTFYYIGKGAQSYAFLSEDQSHVIKFFKFKHLKPNWITEALPDWYFSEYKKKKIARKKRLLNSVFDGYKLGFERHKEETGLVYLHLNKTKNLNQLVTLIDKIGREHIVDVDATVFVIQKNITTLKNVMTEALRSGDLPLAKKRITQIFSLYLQEYSKGIYDRDHGIMHNTGFIGEKPIHLDIGKLSSEPKMRQMATYKPDLIIVGLRAKTWIEANFPEYAEELVTHIEKSLSDVFEEEFSF